MLPSDIVFLPHLGHPLSLLITAPVGGGVEKKEKDNVCLVLENLVKLSLEFMFWIHTTLVFYVSCCMHFAASNATCTFKHGTTIFPCVTSVNSPFLFLYPLISSTYPIYLGMYIYTLSCKSTAINY